MKITQIENSESEQIRAIAFYLPQFHPVRENDEWWEKGFTEWRNVAKAKPLFPGHYQPHLPTDLGFYDLRLHESRQAQVELARQHGIHGFCYYHYWFNGRRILERPFDEVLESGKPDFPFCLCWANENWSRAWDGGERHLLLQQTYSHEDDEAHIRSLIPALRDHRYIRVNGKPLLLIYRTELLPDPARTAEIWRKEAMKAGIGNIYLARVESFSDGRVDPRSIGFDAAVEFAPDWRNVPAPLYRRPLYVKLAHAGLIPDVHIKHRVADYAWLVQRMLAKPPVEYLRFPCVSPGFDNSARRAKDALILIGNTPEIYESWLRQVAAKTRQDRSGDERIVFINAWNEWAEGNHLEPDAHFGRGFLEATQRALSLTGDLNAKDPLGFYPENQADEGFLGKQLRRVKTGISELRYLARLRTFWNGRD